MQLFADLKAACAGLLQPQQDHCLLALWATGNGLNWWFVQIVMMMYNEEMPMCPRQMPLHLSLQKRGIFVCLLFESSLCV